ncbi:bacillithiol biosynthesis cysteine-adding enzyme BshC [Kurthia sibirica]|uniref:Putative cysteine ligase BshC n=1 Tax=Kurthia sibirica TaxID=202750 RepID=A0A2U3AQK1_9BACL|nr:bacillithiol biosynthesis cysteine-adding enzyme BshC [Kurthia sibirica]PWI26811.1 bacillithiol biosynthesis cysteine-adding enzyme BshC [Kurthia sibirica]GEK32652.1 putative cysteine ligase BshC [Kurthia sibirica]
MKLEQVHVENSNKLLQDYRDQQATLSSFFHYKNDQTSFEQRLKDLAGHPIRRKELTAIIRHFMSDLASSNKIEQHLNELEQDAVVVVGGQQAGLLTGPLYSVNKAISVLLVAQQQREKLGVPIVPVFWVAGEDHDIDEINHTFSTINGRLVKHVLTDSSKVKKMASATLLNHQKLAEWIEHIFSQFGETAYTKKLVEETLEVANNSVSYTDFFVKLMNDLFKEYGLLYIDAADPALRQYEAPYFERLIEHSEEIAALVTARETKLDELGYGAPIGATEDAANLFYVKEGERFLLSRVNGSFVNNAANLHFTKEEMKKLAHEEACFSNNVVTRPMMQDMVFPVLAFIGGPGELAYWSTLKDGFELLDMQVPVFVPRMNISYVTRETEHNLQAMGITAAQAISGEVAKKKAAYDKKIYDDEAKQAIERAKQLVTTQYKEIQEHLAAKEIHLERIVDKNLDFHQQQFDFLMKQIEKDIRLKHDVAFKQFMQVESELLPAGGFQERVYSPYPYLNQYGQHFIENIMALSFEVSDKHSIVYL